MLLSKKNIITLLFLVSLNYSTALFAQENAIGKIIMSHGDCYAVEANQQKHSVKRGDNLFAREKLMTGANGNLQIRFSDNALIALGANSEYRVDSYKFNNSQDSKGKYAASIP